MMNMVEEVGLEESTTSVVCNKEDQMMMQMIMMNKGKRTKRQRQPSPLGLAIIPSIIMPNHSSTRSTTENSLTLFADLPTTTTTTTSNRSTSEEEEEEVEDEDLANCLLLLSHGGHHNNNKKVVGTTTGGEVYECKTCNRCFPSFQALGGHRASHKKPKMVDQHMKQIRSSCFVRDCGATTTSSTALTLQMSSNPTSSSSNSRSCLYSSPTTKTKKVHECSICGSEFTSGQALGGHMRRHRAILSTSISPSAAAATTTSNSMSNGTGNHVGSPNKVLKLDLNLPAPRDEDNNNNNFSFHQSTKGKVIVFSAPSSNNLVHCHY